MTYFHAGHVRHGAQGTQENPLRHTILRATALLLAGALSVLAQSGTGTISGTVTDPQDATIAGVEITVRNTATNAVFRDQ